MISGGGWQPSGSFSIMWRAFFGGDVRCGESVETFEVG